jgi:hypothetical protein
MVFNATFNSISVILWCSVLLVEETEVPGENHRPAEPMGSRVISSSCFWLDTRLVTRIVKGSSWSWSYGCWIYNYLCNQSLSPLRLWVRVSIIARCTRYNITRRVSHQKQELLITREPIGSHLFWFWWGSFCLSFWSSVGSFVLCLSLCPMLPMSVGGFLRVLRFPQPIKLNITI